MSSDMRLSPPSAKLDLAFRTESSWLTLTTRTGILST
jgi:hypothetical protein